MSWKSPGNLLGWICRHPVNIVLLTCCLFNTYAIILCLQQVYFGASVTKFYLAFDVLGISCFTGMSYLVRKAHLDDVKGLSYFGRFLAEDFFLAKYLHERQAYLLRITSALANDVPFFHVIAMWNNVKLCPTI